VTGESSDDASRLGAPHRLGCPVGRCLSHAPSVGARAAA
jgi:hypothetical protein